MGLYQKLHRENLIRKKIFCEAQIKYYNEWLMQINKELMDHENNISVARS